MAFSRRSGAHAGSVPSRILPLDWNSVGAPNETPIICPAHPPRTLSSNAARERVRMCCPARRTGAGTARTRAQVTSARRTVRCVMQDILLGLEAAGWRLEPVSLVASRTPVRNTHTGDSGFTAAPRRSPGPRGTRQGETLRAGPREPMSGFDGGSSHKRRVKRVPKNRPCPVWPSCNTEPPPYRVGPPAAPRARPAHVHAASLEPPAARPDLISAHPPA